MNSGDEARVPRGGLFLMALILVAMALLAIYSNVQKAHLNRIETVTVKSPPFSSDAPSPSPTP